MATKYAPDDGGFQSTATPLTGALTLGFPALYDEDFLFEVGCACMPWSQQCAFGLDLGSPKAVKTIIVYDNQENTVWLDGNRDSMDVYKSDDNMNWTLVDHFDGPTRLAKQFTLELSLPHTARYFKVWNTEFQSLCVEGFQSIAITELEFYPLPAEYHLTGTVKQQSANVVRTVRSYIRSTGELYDSTQSAANGTYTLLAPDNTTLMFVIAFDDDAGDVYNALILDRVTAILQP